MQPILQQLSDERECQAIGLRYARALDGRDFALLLTCFKPDTQWGPAGAQARGHIEIERTARYLCCRRPSM